MPYYRIDDSASHSAYFSEHDQWLQIQNVPQHIQVDCSVFRERDPPISNV